MSPVHIMYIDALPPGLDDLRRVAAGEGFRFLERMAGAWRAGTNRFEGPGERLLGAFRGGALVGLGGLTLDPHEPPQTRAGRLRHLYVLPAERRHGIGSMLVGRLLADAQGRFSVVKLRTDQATAAAFYERLGFAPVAEANATHRLTL